MPRSGRPSARFWQVRRAAAVWADGHGHARSAWSVVNCAWLRAYIHVYGAGCRPSAAPRAVVMDGRIDVAAPGAPVSVLITYFAVAYTTQTPPHAALRWPSSPFGAVTRRVVRNVPRLAVPCSTQLLLRTTATGSPASSPCWPATTRSTGKDEGTTRGDNGVARELRALHACVVVVRVRVAAGEQ